MNVPSRRSLVTVAVLAGALAPLSVAPAASAATPTDYSTPAPAVSIGRRAAGHEAQLVAAEDRRLQDIRTISTLARWQNRAQRAPYRVGTPYGYTLVLTARSEPYVLSDLLKLEPQTLLRLSDGSYLLKEHIVVLDGAELDLTTPGLVLRMSSEQDGFATIVSYGGRLKLLGSPARPLRITSWNLGTGRPDHDTDDGRAYVRALGGQVQMSYVHLSDLGFWSGRTGGLSLTGTDRPNTGALDIKSTSVTGSVGGLQVLPTGPLPTGSAGADDHGIYTNTFVAARIDHIVTEHDAIGLFVSGADGVAISDSQFLDSQITGVDLHRFVTSSSIQRTESDGSGGVGFNLGRATEGVQLTQCTARGNAGDGFALSGAPLADGPSAVGSPITRYGNDSLSNSIAAANGHYGIFVNNGFNITLSSNQVSASPMGIVVMDEASRVSINGNHVRGTGGYGIALLNGVRRSWVIGNVVSGARIYMRDSQGSVQGNSVLSSMGHGISVVGAADGTSVTNNVVTGTGTSAIDTARAGGTVTVRNNLAAGWQDTTSLWVQYWHMLLHPMSLLWAAILGLVLLSMIKGLRRGEVVLGTNPYGRKGAQLVYTSRP
jgi:parallel beta-helix repeat protein